MRSILLVHLADQRTDLESLPREVWGLRWCHGCSNLPLIGTTGWNPRHQVPYWQTDQWCLHFCWSNRDLCWLNLQFLWSKPPCLLVTASLCIICVGKNLHFCWLTLPFLFMFHLGPGLGSQEGFSLGTTAARIALRGSPAKGIGNIETAKGNVKSWAISIYIPSDCRILIWLMVWNIFYFSIQLGIIIPTDEVHHFSEGLKPPTSLWSIEISIHQSS